ncbi:PEP-CTERM protein-sorting domain-containing protein/choice-of-anchor A domain-containing protein [Duganella sp. CF402]|uniref:choice-of-anchor A family protein n=1 Tax=unclassified Duganella TaxID=2636909 RepID=UPI0008C96946|nr:MULTISPECIES: choice-of-anchor A family protein [unclassified Duganella]RZT04126.1 putative secreted protein with PEP-CTERM sorting signal/choice-of-anchor A domain-containing protein [Duganella sp. BK701]SEM47257.1 PEP-CTERM protein-sorting domain-containing protein/choice-of-anchor A domain-containing protein [Duganella sp. CF402]
MTRTVALTALMLAGSVQAATAPAPLTALQTLQQFNTVVLTNVKSDSHIDGRTWIGGSLTGNNSPVFDMHPGDVPASNYAGLTVMGVGVAPGGYAVNNAQVTDNGTVVYGNTSKLGINNGHSAIYGNTDSTDFNGSGSYYVSGTAGSGNHGVTQITASTFAGSVQETNSLAAGSTNFAGVLGGLSSQLKSLASTGSTVSIVGEQANFTAVVKNGVAVFDLTAIDTQLFSNTVKRFSFSGLDGATSVIFNTDITSATLADDFLGGAAPNYGAKMIWNFYNATSLTVQNQFGGSILATKATLTNNQNIEGGVYVNALDQHAEIHLRAYTGTLPVPEPETYAMLLAGLGLIGFMARRCRT